MVEAVLLSIASKILLTIASPAFMKAYAKSSSIWGAREGLEALKGTINTIQATLEDADTNQDRRARLNNWIEQIGDVLHEADDLFDEVAANELLKQQVKGNKVLKEVKVHFSKLNPVTLNYVIAKEVENIRKRLELISRDESIPNPGRHQPVEQRSGGTTAGSTTSGWYINPEGIVGRDKDLKAILDFLFYKKNVKERTVPVIAIVGIGGIGKTTLAQLICGDKQVQKQFKKRWWLNIPDTIGETEILLRIFESIQEKSYEGDICQLSFQIRNLVKQTTEDPRNYLLILDGVRDQENLGIWYNIIGLLSAGAKGSKIIVTTRDRSVANAMGAIKTYDLGGLSKDFSQELFKRIAFTEDQLNDLKRIDLGHQIVDKCANNPLAIKSIAAVLCSKTSIGEWESVRDDPKLQCQGDGADSIMSSLRLSFDNLKPEVKSCFAYCSLFPKRHEIVREELIYLWIAQGYVKSKTSESLESVGNGYFNELLRMYFFEELKKDKYGEIITCKMHDLYHQLAEDVAGVHNVTLTKERMQFDKRNRHLTVGCVMDIEWTVPESLLIADRLRSSLFIYRGSLSPLVLDKLFTAFKFLRALNLEDLKLREVSDSVGELKLLRYLNLSNNTFESLPSSMVKLVNLLTLDISHCEQLKALPGDFRMLVNLTVLNARECRSLMHMPPRFWELTSLKYLSYFNVGQESTGGHRSSSVLNKLWRKLHKDRNERIQLPTSVRVLKTENPTMKMPYWDRRADIPLLFPNLVKLHVFNSQTINCLPPLRCLSSLKDLKLSNLKQLQYIEENEESERTQSITTEAGSSTEFFPCLEDLILETLPNLKGWLREVEGVPSRSIAANQMPPFPSLLNLRIEDCGELKSIPLSERLQTLNLCFVTEELVQQLLPVACSHSSSSSTPSFLTSLSISACNSLSFQFESLTSLQCLELENCSNLENLYFVPTELNVLKELQILNCPKLESYGLNNSWIGSRFLNSMY